MWDGKSSPLAIIKAKINVILESLCVLEIGQDANQDGDYDFAWLACLSWVNSMVILILEFQACFHIFSGSKQKLATFRT